MVGGPPAAIVCPYLICLLELQLLEQVLRLLLGRKSAHLGGFLVCAETWLEMVLQTDGCRTVDDGWSSDTLRLVQDVASVIR